MKKLNSLIAFKSALLSLLMMVLAIPAWAVNVSYSSSTLTLTITGSITKEDVQKVSGRSTAINLVIKSDVNKIGRYAFDDCVALETITIEASTEPLHCPLGLFSTVSENETFLQFTCYRDLVRDYYTEEPNAAGIFSNNQKLATVTLGGEMTYINSDLFTNCKNLYSVDLSRATKLKEIGSTAFECTKLKQITLPNSVTTIGDEAFRYCSNLNNVVIPNSVTTIGDEAFRYCSNLNNVVIPNSVTSLGEYAFDHCTNLTNISLPNSLTNIPYDCFNGCTNLKNVTIPNSVKNIKSEAFENCSSLSSITIPQGVEGIGGRTFKGCTNLASVEIMGFPTVGTDAFPETAKVIYVNATYDQWLTLHTDNTVTELYIDNDNIANYLSFTTSNNLAKQFPNVKKVTFSPYVTAIGNYLFYNSATLETIVFEGDPVAVGLRSFQDCKMLATVGNGKVKSVDNHSFAGCTSLKSIEITDDDIIGPNAFQDCSALESVTFPSSLTAITNTAFANCTALKAVSFPANVETINPFAFRGCTALEKVTFGKNIRTIQSSAFGNCTALKQVTFMGSKDLLSAKYTATDNLATRFPYAETITLRLITSIGDYAFAGSSALKTIDNNSSVESIGTGAFANCTNLSSILQTYLLTIGANAFENCQSLTEFYVSDNITELQANTFKGCTGLKIMTLGTRLATIDKSAVEGCTSLTDLRILSTTLASKVWKADENLHHIFPYVTTLTYGPNITDISPWIFHVNEDETGSLQSITFKNASGVDIKWNAFDNNKELTTVEGNVKNIGAYAFRGCSQLQEISFTDDAEEIEVYAFKGCTSLTSITLAKELKILRQSSFEGCTNLKEVAFHGSNITPDNTEKQWTSNYNFCTIFPYVERIAFAPAARLVASSAFSCGVNKNPHPLKSVRFWGITEVEKDAFYNQENLTTVEGRLKSAGESAFEGTSIESITFDDTYATPTIGNNAFAYCSSLKTVKLSNRIETIGSMAFFRCASLTEIVIPDRVSEIQDLAFFNSGLNKVICHREEPISISTVVFDGFIMQRAELLVPAASIAAYKAAPVWQDFYKISASDAITIADGTAYTNDQDILVPAVRYTRTFSEKTAGKWQCLYVPFDLPVTEELLSDFDFAKLYMISYKDANNNGEIEDGEPLVMLLSKVSAGKTLKGNTPYFIKAKTAGTKNIEVMETTTIHAAASGYVDCSTTEHYYKLVGTNDTFNVNGNYTLNTSGQFSYYSKDTNIKANRWYMSITSRTDGNPVYVSRPIEILVDGEDDATGIMDIRADRSSRSAEGIFTLDGRKISDTENLPSGIYIKNGKKVVIK